MTGPQKHDDLAIELQDGLKALSNQKRLQDIFFVKLTILKSQFFSGYLHVFLMLSPTIRINVFIRH